METFTFIVSVILIILLVVDWTATTILFRASRKAKIDNIALRERAKMAGTLAIASTINAIFAINRLLELEITTPIILIALSMSLILGSVPNMYWLSLYLRNRLHK